MWAGSKGNIMHLVRSLQFWSRPQLYGTPQAFCLPKHTQSHTISHKPQAHGLTRLFCINAATPLAASHINSHHSHSHFPSNNPRGHTTIHTNSLTHFADLIVHFYTCTHTHLLFLSQCTMHNWFCVCVFDIQYIHQFTKHTDPVSVFSSLSLSWQTLMNVKMSLNV